MLSKPRCLMSLPGAKEQLWHVDGEHLYTSEPNLACYGSTQQVRQYLHNCCLHRHSLYTFIGQHHHHHKSYHHLLCHQDKFFKDNSAILPAHCLNIFVPLVDVEVMITYFKIYSTLFKSKTKTGCFQGRNGGTEFCLGSHFHSKFMAEDIVWQASVFM